MIFVLRGTSLAGKSNFVGRFFSPHCVLSSDQIRLQLFDDVDDQTKNGLVFDHINYMLDKRLRYGTAYTVVDATHLKFKDCTSYIDLAKKFGKGVTVISIDPPGTDVLLERNLQRAEIEGRFITEEVIHRHLTNYHSCMPRFKEASFEFPNYTFVRINQDWEVVS